MFIRLATGVESDRPVPKHLTKCKPPRRPQPQPRPRKSQHLSVLTILEKSEAATATTRPLIYASFVRWVGKLL